MSAAGRADVGKDTEEQRALWNGTAGQAWVDNQELLDGMFRGFEELLVEEVAAHGARAVLDVGCGTGSTTLAMARRLRGGEGEGGGGRCVGVDISAPMIEVARARAEREGVAASFVVGNAADHAFEAASFDLIASRFGVMFFEDPVRAFANLRGAARRGAVMRCIAWRSAAENPFMTTAERAAAPLLPDLPARRAEGPGQFAFANGEKVRGLLEASGWGEIEVRPLDVACAFPVEKLPQYLARLGPIGMALQSADEETRARVIETARAAFAPFVSAAQVRYTAACWMLCARG